MVRRAMEGNRRIGMAQVSGVRRGGEPTIEDVVCEGEITECQPLPDG